MSQNQTNSKANIKFGDLTKAHQEILCKYFPIVEKEFSVQPGVANKSDIPADIKYKADVVNFLRTIEAVFGDTPPIHPSLECIVFGKDIIERAVTGSRISYRKIFRGYSYLTAFKLEKTHSLIEKEAMVAIAQSTIKAEETAILKEKLSESLRLQRKWIDEVNNFKKNSILSEITAEVLENLWKTVREKLPSLFENTPTKIYEEPVLRKIIEELEAKAYESFQEEIPFLEDENSAPKINADFQFEVKKCTHCFYAKNRTNIHNAERVMTLAVDQSVTTYKKAITAILNEGPLFEPDNIRIQHENTQELNLPLLTNLETIPIDHRTKFIEKYLKTTDQMFLDQLITMNPKINQGLEKCYHDVCIAVNQETAAAFSAHKIPNAYLERVQHNFKDQLEKIINELKGTLII